MRKHATLAALLITLFTGVAYAQPGPGMNGMPYHHPNATMWHHPGAKAGPFWMHGRMGVPFMLPFVELHSYDLKLTNEQASKLAIWRNEHLQELMPAVRDMWRDRLALHRDLLAGKSMADVRGIAEAIDKAHATILDLKIAQVEAVRATLTPEQWHEAVRMYRDVQQRYMNFRPGFGWRNR